MRGALMESLGVGFFDLFGVVLVGADGVEVELWPTAPAAEPSALALTDSRSRREDHP
jgi:hypothetical protein